ncbi:MAG: hypothetical protein BWK78_03335 [Thiotrichaceae bacterium IS1]|nr:MAG: hypothetical protein BWK78_03335 [Thiotrichaceae bacterium IS1]
MKLPCQTVFVDTSFLVALLRRNDSDHAKALTLYQRVKAEKVRKMTSEYVLLELGNGLSRLGVRRLAVDFFNQIYQDNRFEIVPATTVLFTEALALFKARPDKEWGLVDCTSFIIMQKYKVDTALSADHHFRQAGFCTLLLED